MDPLFWILACVVAACVVGILLIWRLEMRAERRAADTRQVEAEVSARLKIFDPRVAVEAVDTRPIQAALQPGIQATPPPVAQEAPPSWEPELSLPPAPVAPPVWADELQPEPTLPPAPVASSVWADELQPAVDAQRELVDVPLREAEAQLWSEPEIPLPPPPAPVFVEEREVVATGNVEATFADMTPPTPELARVRAAELGRERRYLEQAIEEEQDRLAQLLHIQVSVGSPDSAPIRQLQSELAQQRQRLQEIILLEERYRQAAVPSLEQMAQEYKNAASPHTPRAFGVRRHSLAPVEQPGKNPPAPPTQASTDSSS